MSEDVVDTLPPVGLDETQATRSSQTPETESAPVVPGTVIGRYVVLSKLGAGAMGMVLAAYDPELDRKVALKLLKSRRGSQEASQARLRREAQALAKLDHPNVVSVHDVGVHEGELFVGMEFVEGQTLGEWMAATERPRSWREVVRVFAEAGRGLAAAHEAGLVHRDFKPDNVMLGADGRVRVMDFGLARARSQDDRPSESAIEQIHLHAREPQHVALTQTGAMTGTPAYMSIEQFEGKGVDARSDQFGFCVALYEALYGERPFAGKGVGELVHEVMHAHVREPPKGTKVPLWLRKVVVRGLAVDKDARWPSMAALLNAMTDDPAVRRRKWWVGTLVAGVVAGGAWAVWYATQLDADTCAGMEAKLEGVWDDERRAAVRASIEGTQLSYAAETWERVELRLDDYARDWVAARVEACEATHRGEQSGELLDLRMACLDERLSHMRATVAVLAAADETVVKKAVTAVAALPKLDRCADVNALTAELPPPEDPEVAQQVEQLNERMIDAAARYRAGKHEEALTLVGAVAQEAEAIGYEPLHAQARLFEGHLQVRTSKFEEAEATLEQAYELAVGLRMKDEAAEASRRLVYLIGDQLARHEDGRQWAKHAEPLARAAGTDEALSNYLNTIGSVAVAEGKYEEARDCQERALAIMEKAVGPDHLDVAVTLNGLGAVAYGEGKYAEAVGYLERALKIYENALGPGHPDIATFLSNLGVLTQAAGEFEQARAHLERARAIWEKTVGPEHPDVAYALANLGMMDEGDGKHDEARQQYERALAIWEKTVGSEHPLVAFALNGLGNVALAKREFETAHGHFERALAIREKALGPEHPDVAATLDDLGDLASEQEDHAQAYGYYERALALREKALGADHPHVADTLTGLGEALLGQAKPADARPLLERALSIRTSNEVDPVSLAETRFALARVLWAADTDPDRARARELAGQARDAFASAGEVATMRLGEVERWLTDR